MGKVKNSGISGAFGKGVKIEPNVRAIFPTAPSQAVANAFQQSIDPIVIEGDLQQSSKECWHNLDDLYQTIAEGVVKMANNIQENVSMIRRVGVVQDLKEFERNIITANNDLQRFTEELLKIKNRHAGKVGFVETPEDTSLFISIFEDYRAFYTYFEAAMHHSLITFTEYALHAKDILLAQEQKEAEKNNQSTEEKPETTQGTQA